jgi:hypothetical protein
MAPERNGPHPGGRRVANPHQPAQAPPASSRQPAQAPPASKEPRRVQGRRRAARVPFDRACAEASRRATRDRVAEGARGQGALSQNALKHACAEWPGRPATRPAPLRGIGRAKPERTRSSRESERTQAETRIRTNPSCVGARANPGRIESCRKPGRPGIRTNPKPVEPS